MVSIPIQYRKKRNGLAGKAEKTHVKQAQRLPRASFEGSNEVAHCTGSAVFARHGKALCIHRAQHSGPLHGGPLHSGRGALWRGSFSCSLN